MEKDTIVLMLVVLLIIAGVWLIVASERKRMKELKNAYQNVNIGDKYMRMYITSYGPKEVESDVVRIVDKTIGANGIPMVCYEYEGDDTPYDAPFEDFLDCFDKMED